MIFVFVSAAAVGFVASRVLVSRIERVCSGLAAAVLGLVAGLAADTPEITTALTALAHHERRVGFAVVLGANAFQVAALLGLGAVVAGRISLHRRVVVLSGVVALSAAGASTLTVTGNVSPTIGLLVGGAVFIAYLIALIVGRRRGRTPKAWRAWLVKAIAEEESEIAPSLEMQRATPRDAVAALVALLAVIASGIAMERSASVIGHRYHVPDVILGGVILAAVTSLPNAVAANYLALRGRGAAVLSTALNGNAINAIFGLLIPATIIGVSSTADSSLAVAYLALTVLALAITYARRSLERLAGAAIIAAYIAFIGVLVARA